MKECPTQRPPKRAIKLAVKELLKGKTEARDNVSVFQSVPTQIEEIPAILIYMTTEDIDVFEEAPKLYKRTPTLTIECLLDGDNDDELDERLEKMGELVETFMDSDVTLGGLINKLALTSTAYASSSEGSTFTGSLILTYALDLYTYAMRPDAVCLPDLKEINATWEVGPNQEIEANDEYKFEQEGDP